MYVEVYWNLHRKRYSVRALQGPMRGRVIRHLSSLSLTDAKFVVQPAGRAKVLRDKVKNVHAFVRGEFNTQTLPPADFRVTYNPYRDETFVALRDGERQPIHEAAFVTMDCAPVDGGGIHPFMYAR